MNISNVVRPQKRIDTSYNSTLGIQAYGRDNLYPQRMIELLKGSPTGGTCRDRYETFLVGDGFADESVRELPVNSAGDTAGDILRLVGRDMSLFNGFALHVSYDLTARITELHYVPFETCRLTEEDDAGRVPFIAVHPDWSGTKTRRGKKLQVKKTNVEYFYPYNPMQNVVLSQIEQDGGIDNYKGQILWYSLDGRNVYPAPIYDKIVTALSTDEGLDNVKYRNVRNNFLPAGMIIKKKGVTVSVDADGRPIGGNSREDEEFTNNLQLFQGDTNAGAIMEVTINADEDTPEWREIKSANYDKEFTATEASVTERIYSAFGQEPWHAIRVGKLGFSGTVISEAYEYYNSYVAKERREIERVFARIFGKWHEPLSGNYTIAPLTYVINAKQTAL